MLIDAEEKLAETCIAMGKCQYSFLHLNFLACKVHHDFSKVKLCFAR